MGFIRDPEAKNRKDIYVTKEQFIELLKHNYQNYLKMKNRLTYEANAYGVIPFKQSRQGTGVRGRIL